MINLRQPKDSEDLVDLVENDIESKLEGCRYSRRILFNDHLLADDGSLSTQVLYSCLQDLYIKDFMDSVEALKRIYEKNPDILSKSRFKRYKDYLQLAWIYNSGFQDVDTMEHEDDPASAYLESFNDKIEQ